MEISPSLQNWIDRHADLIAAHPELLPAIGYICDTQGGFIGLDIDDIMATVQDADVIDTLSVDSEPDELKTNLTDSFAKLQSRHPGLKPTRLLTHIVMNPEIPVTMDQMGGVSDAFKELPEDTEVIWGLGKDEESGGKLKIVLLCSFK